MIIEQKDKMTYAEAIKMLRKKETLITNFANGINEVKDVMAECHAYLAEQKERIGADYRQ